MIYRITKLLPIIILLGVCACNYSEDENSKGAVESAEEWLLLVDEGKYLDSWMEAASTLKTRITKEQWETALIDFRKILGIVHSRTLTSKDNYTSLPGSHDNESLTIQYKTNFENHSSVTETIKVTLEKNGTWLVSGYDIQP